MTSRRRRVNRRQNQIRKIGATICIIIVALVLFNLFKSLFFSLPDKYNMAENLDTMISSVVDTEYTDSFASDLCVVTDNVVPFDEFSAESGILCSYDGGDAIWSESAFSKMYPASTTKIMTAILAIKYGNLEDMITVTDDAIITEAGASLAGINPGDELSLEQLLYGLMLPSGNDAANAIAVHIGGSLEGFADMMNQEAYEIGATKTHFVNANGLSDTDHYTSAYDLYLIMHEALKYDEFRHVASTATYIANYKLADGSMVSKTWSNGNKYLSGDRSEPDGLSVVAGKTGTTQAAGSCLVLASKDENDKIYISIVLKAENRDSLYDNMSGILGQISQLD